MPDVLDLKSPVMKGAVMRCVFSMLFFRYGSPDYSSVLQEGQSGGQRRGFPSRDPKVELAFFVMAVMWESHFRS